MSEVIRNYGRDDVEYDSWFSNWSKQLARSMTRAEIESALGISESAASAGARSHLRAIQATGSMTGQSTRRAHSRNVMAAAGEKAIALRSALEIHDLFPEHALMAGAVTQGEG